MSQHQFRASADSVEATRRRILAFSPEEVINDVVMCKAADYLEANGYLEEFSLDETKSEAYHVYDVLKWTEENNAEFP